MYSIYANNVCIYDDVSALENMKVNSPKLTLTENAAGSLVITLPQTNVGYGLIERLITDISVRKEGEEIWMGRVLSESRDFYNNRVLTCEGQLSFFNDSIQPPYSYGTNMTVGEVIRDLVNIHNSQVPLNRQFSTAQRMMNNNTLLTTPFYTNYDNTMSAINSLIETYGGVVQVGRVNGTGYLDYFTDDDRSTCGQIIRFGVNLIDFTKSWDMSEFATVIVPLGARLNKSEIEGLDAYLTVEEENNGSIYVESSNEAIAAYGRIVKTVNFDDVEDARILLSKAQDYLAKMQFDDMTLELSALDLHYLDVDTDDVMLSNNIVVISPPHGMTSLNFPVTQLEIPLDGPEKTQFKLGKTVQTSLTEIHDKTKSSIMDSLKVMPHDILKDAKDNATAIMNRATNGYITIEQDETGSHSEALYISKFPKEELDFDDPSAQYWKWSMDGLGYTSNGGSDYDVAITMDGAIVADYITAGILNGNVLRTGKIMNAPRESIVVRAADIYGHAIKFFDISEDENTHTYTYLPVFSMDIPESVTVEYEDSGFVSEFIWSQADYPGSSNPHLDGKPVYVLATEGQNQNGNPDYSFINVELVNHFRWSLADYPGSTDPDLDDKQVYVLTVKGAGDMAQYTDMDNVVQNPTYTFIEDEYAGNNVIIDLDTGELMMKNGSIKIGAYDRNSKHYKFEVDSDGNIYAGSGTFAGRLVAATGSFKGVVIAEDFRDKYGHSMLEYKDNLGKGMISSQYLNLGNIIIDGQSGNISMSGNLNLSQLSSITWGSYKPLRYQYSVDGTGNWHDTMSEQDMFRKESVDNGVSWGTPYQFRGIDGSDANVDFQNINNAISGILAKVPIDGTLTTIIDSATIFSPTILGGTLAAVDPNNLSLNRGYTAMTPTGLNVYAPNPTQNPNPKIGLGYVTDDYSYPYLSLGIGTSTAGGNGGIIMKFGSGLWIGTSDVINTPSPKNSPAIVSTTSGIFMDFNAGMSLYVNGETIGINGGGTGGIAVFG